MKVKGCAERARDASEIIGIAGDHEVAPGQRSDNDGSINDVRNAGAPAGDTCRASTRFVQFFDLAATQQP